VQSLRWQTGASGQRFYADQPHGTRRSAQQQLNGKRPLPVPALALCNFEVPRDQMCGIHVVFSSSSPHPHTPSHELASRLRNRGPDHLGSVVVQVGPDTETLTCTSTVLALRGDHVTAQPFHDSKTGSVLCWNGEAWRIAGRELDGNDGEAVFSLLVEASSSSATSDARAYILDALRSIEGPFAFAYFDKPSQTLFFARDRLGRRSLVSYQDEASGTFIVSSIAESCDPAWKEVEFDGIYHLYLGATSGARLSPSWNDWQVDNQDDVVSSAA